MHRILLRQMERALGLTPQLPDSFEELLRLVSATYESFDEDRVLIERSLEISSRELRLGVATMSTTLDSVGEGVLVMGADQKISYYNKRFIEIWELPKTEVIASRTEDVFKSMIEKSADQTLFREVLTEARTGQEVDIDRPIKLNNDNFITVKCYPQLLEGQSVGQVCIFRDITKYIRFQKEIQDKVTTLERLNKTMIDREMKMIELKSRILALEAFSKQLEDQVGKK